EVAEGHPDSLREQRHHHTAQQEPNARFPYGGEKDRTRMQTREPHKSRQPQRRHKGDCAVVDATEQWIMSPEMTYEKSGEQRADARTQGDFNVANGKGDENANDPAEENRQP